MKNTLAMTDKEYTDNLGNLCPFCRRFGAIEGDQVEIDGGTAWQNCTCTECGMEWTDFYRLVGYEPLMIP